MEIQPIKTKTDYEAALAEIERLWGSALNTPEGDKLDLLLILVDNYEQQHYPIDPPDPIEVIKFYMDQQGLTLKDLEPYLGKPHRVLEVLNRQRQLSLSMIRKLHEGLRIPLESLLYKSA